MIKVDGRPSESYWMELMRNWLISLQTQLDRAIDAGYINGVNGSFSLADKRVTDDMRLARRLLCSYAGKFNCTGRVSDF